MVRLFNLPEAFSTPLSLPSNTNGSQIRMGRFTAEGRKKSEPGLHILSLNASKFQKQTANTLHPNPGENLPEKHEKIFTVDETTSTSTFPVEEIA